MIKLLATTAIGLVMMSGAANASVDHCGLNESRMNPVELSLYQECWLDEYRMDENYGTLGSLFWVRANEQYYSTQLKNLRYADGREAFLGHIENSIIDDFKSSAELQELQARLINASTAVAYYESQRDYLYETSNDADSIQDLQTALAKIVELNATIDTLKGTIKDLEMNLAQAEIDKDDAYDLGVSAGIAKAQNMVSYSVGTSTLMVGGETFNSYKAVVKKIKEHGYDEAFAKGEAKGFAEGVASVAFTAHIKGNDHTVKSNADLVLAINTEKHKSWKKGINSVDMTADNAKAIADAVAAGKVSWNEGFPFAVVGNGIQFSLSGKVLVGGESMDIQAFSEVNLTTLGLFTTAQLEDAKTIAKKEGVDSVTVEMSQIGFNPTITATLSNGKTATFDIQDTIDNVLANHFDVTKVNKSAFNGTPNWELLSQDGMANQVSWYNAGYKAGEADTKADPMWNNVVTAQTAAKELDAYGYFGVSGADHNASSADFVALTSNEVSIDETGGDDSYLWDDDDPNSVVAIQVIANAGLNDQTDKLVTFTDYYGTSKKIEFISGSWQIVESFTAAVVTGFEIGGYKLTQTQLEALDTLPEIEAALEDAYNEGYDDGYSAGYADGYSDGFTDGVNSVN